MIQRLLLLVSLLFAITQQRAWAETPVVKPGPEQGGLRLRLEVAQRPEAGQEGYEVHIDVINVSAQPITLRAGWRNEDPGDVKDYLDAATSIECVPAIAPWIGGVMEGQRQAPQPEYVLKAGETLPVRWQTDGRHLKNRVTNPNEVQNPKFPFPGLYSVHATLEVITSERTVKLRSNEQLVSVGGSHAMPKHTMGPLLDVDGEKKTAMVALGSMQQIAVGDQFEIGSPKGMHWRLTITHVKPNLSWGDLELLTRATFPAASKLPQPNMPAVLVQRK